MDSGEPSKKGWLRSLYSVTIQLWMKMMNNLFKITKSCAM